MAKTARTVINYCLDHDIGHLVVGYHKEFQRDCNIGTINNQNFVNIPFGKLRDKLEYLCQLYGIGFTEQEESYTSKASFFRYTRILDIQREYIWPLQNHNRFLCRHLFFRQHERIQYKHYHMGFLYD
ncbi:IS605 OrfB family transposase [Aequitasia blattaphilus]|uniref:IS200/IS605 family accessory protein TnpB-related protein n=2 Tax=Aequitasia blattaphilus TaxID=2949332 RepID=A0ABT1E7S5_9FIRM|nr:IS200/IS605 family accessory protein TnpB-related protein [Aequitasia blattaphilus]MCR8614509.1 IS200/IS605 family accessory protein TnpB-related protein [Aequitasia blattaphilus]